MIVVSTLLNAGYFLPIVYRAFFVAPSRRPATPRTARRRCRWWSRWSRPPPRTVLLFFFPDLPLALRASRSPPRLT